MSVEDTNDNIPYSIKIEYVMLFAWIFLLFILSWISVAVVGRAIDNICFTTLGLSDKSTLHTCVIALVIVLIELLTLYYFNSLGIPIYSVMPDINNLYKSKTNNNSKTSENSTQENQTKIKEYYENDINFFDEMSGITMLARIEGIAII